MVIRVKARTGKKTSGIYINDTGIYEVSVKVQPIDGKANEAIIEELASYFKVPKRAVEIASGHSSPLKKVIITTE